ncbi:MAG: EAL domain-containing protein [Deltaproteobacteria bacterium]|nr:EAL domain-containing protein [Deltaproteobacteria bacterium]
MFELGVDPEFIVFEITETAAISNISAAVKFLRSLKSVGCHISLDDFGVGHTSFLYLKEMHIDYLKIAGPFIKNMDKNLNDQLFVKAIVNVAKGLNIKTVAEFVETDEVMEILKEIGVDYAQGYFVGRPSPTLDYQKAS